MLADLKNNQLNQSDCILVEFHPNFMNRSEMTHLIRHDRD